jgi:hypothetical protein
MRQVPLSFGATEGDETHFLSSFHQLAENLLCLAVKESIFNVQQNRVMCRPEDCFSQVNEIAGFGGLNLCSWLC